MFTRPQLTAPVAAVLTATVCWAASLAQSGRLTADSRAGLDWWSLQPVARPARPEVKDAAWPINPIDHFLLAKLESNRLAPAPAADRRTLIRRVHFDLLGLPPGPDDVAAFVADDSAGAYERLVDRLLDSPHYGERWARHWLDVIRFGESQGFERDKLRPNAWPYRDWVIQALNDDMPYDEFARLQLAGDVLRPDDPAAVVATGFLVAGAWDEVGQTQQSAAMKAVVRQDEMEDIVGVTGQTFLGLTVHCARCHDHKFDPITQQDYYRLVAALGGVRHGERDSVSEAARALRTASVSERHPAGPLTHGRGSDRLAELKGQLASINDPVRERLVAERRARPQPAVEPPQPIARWDFAADLRDQLGSLHGTAHGGARVEASRLLLDGVDSFVATEPLAEDLNEKTLEAWVSLAEWNQQGGGVIGVQSLDGATFDAIVFGEREPGQWMAGSNGYVRTQSFNGPRETEPPDQFVHVAIVYDANQTITAYRNGGPYGQPYSAAGLATFAAGKSQVVFGLRHSPPRGNRLLAGAIRRAQLYDRALSADEIAASAGVLNEAVSDDEIIAQLTPHQRARRQELLLEISRVETAQRLATGGRVYAVVPQQPEPCHVLDRGDTRRPKELVAPGGVQAVSPVGFGLPPDAPEAERRVKLAEWITDPRNPLTARVMANRLWHYHFGVGLVDTPNDFGSSGGRPSHPELLDWLASELTKPSVSQQLAIPDSHPWSLKHLHRLIVTSATYRQSSRFDPAAATIDSGNRLLWRRTPQRLDAETLRDAVLAVAGELNPTMGGPGLHDFRTHTNNSQFYEPIDPAGYAFQRRSIYRTWVRSGTNPFLDVFDCPDPSTTTPRRAMTTTPLQALSLLNDSFMLRMADKFAERLRQDTDADAEKQIDRAYQIAFARVATAAEVAAAKRFVSEHGLAAFCRVLFNSNEFLYVD
jgi:hypothetical protein